MNFSPSTINHPNLNINISLTTSTVFYNNIASWRSEYILDIVMRCIDWWLRCHCHYPEIISLALQPAEHAQLHIPHAQHKQDKLYKSSNQFSPEVFLGQQLAHNFSYNFSVSFFMTAFFPQDFCQDSFHNKSDFHFFKNFSSGIKPV